MIDTKLNVSLDLGHLLVYDNQPFKKDFINEEDMLERGTQNVKNIFQDLFKLCKTQQGEDNEKRDFDKPEDNVMLPKPITVLPRARPVPKPRPLTKWEKFRKEKGLAEKKRSRMVYSEIAGDWVPRWGKGR
jgi:regulator of ribosome biosynthesis